MKNFVRVVAVIVLVIVLAVFAGIFVVRADAAQDERFEIMDSQSLGFNTSGYIIVDNQTNVEYLIVKSGYGVSMTVLVDEAGAPLIWEDGE